MSEQFNAGIEAAAHFVETHGYGGNEFEGWILYDYPCRQDGPHVVADGLRSALSKPVSESTATNAELLRLLERHHIAWVAEDYLHRTDEYLDSELCRLTEAAIERAKESV